MTQPINIYAGGSSSVASKMTSRVKWVVIVILIILVILIAYVVSYLIDNGLSLTDPSTWGAAAVTAFENAFNLTDTGEGLGGSWLKAVWYFSPFGLIGGAAGIGTSSTGWAGIGSAWTTGKNNAYTFYKRLFGG